MSLRVHPCMCASMHVCMCECVECVWVCAQVDRKKAPPSGVFPIYYVPSSRTVRGARQAEGL